MTELTRIEIVKLLNDTIPKPRSIEAGEQIVEGVALFLGPVFCSLNKLGHEAIQPCCEAILQACEDFKDEWREKGN